MKEMAKLDDFSMLDVEHKFVAENLRKGKEEHQRLCNLLEQTRLEQRIHRIFYFNKLRVQYNEAISFPGDKIDITDLSKALSKARQIDRELIIKIKELSMQLKDAVYECKVFADQLVAVMNEQEKLVEQSENNQLRANI